MAWRFEKETGDLVIDGFETGIASSPHKGIANLQGVNISSETGEVNCSFARAANYVVAPTITGGTLTASGGAGDTLLAAPSNLYPGMWINITSTTITGTTTTLNNLLVVGGGGGGGATTDATTGGGGGGAGGYKTASTYTVTLGSAYVVSVGAGGASATNGTDSVFDVNNPLTSITATGGGKGGSDTANGSNGGSGGGGGTGASKGTGVVGQGKDGGDGLGVRATGGGGGASTVGGNGVGSGATNATSGTGGDGTANTISGASVTYAGGGGGGIGTGAGNVAGLGGAGGGGAGGSPSVGNNGTAGTANRGAGGGGGGGVIGATGGAGGSGVVIVTYPTANMTATGGTITTSGSNTIHTFTTSGTFTVTAIAVLISTGNYFVSYRNGSGQVKISSVYDPTVTYSLTHGTSGTATFSTVVTTLGNPIAKAVEKYNDGTVNQYRYYLLDANSVVWVYDTAYYDSTLAISGVGTTWVPPDLTVYSPSIKGIEILNGWLIALSDTTLLAKSTVSLGTAFASIANGGTMNPFTGYPRFCFTGHQGRMYYTDGNYVGSFFPDTSTLTGTANIQSFSQYTASTTTGTITELLTGSLPYSSGFRIPAVFFTSQGGTQPVNLTAQTVYYIGNTAPGSKTFSVYAAASGGAAINIASGAVGNQFFNTFYPLGSDAAPSGSHSTCVLTQQRLNLPVFEVAQSIVEIGNTALIGCQGRTVYPWNQSDVTPSGIISLPEANVLTMLTVNQMAYIFAGTQGNIYITDGSVASLAVNVPDYVAGVPGSPGTYIESGYTWGGNMYLRGRVYFSLLDQTSTKAGNCGGIWSFVPVQNLYSGEDTGLALHLEAQSSYASYNGYTEILIPNEVQVGKFPLYWSGWNSSFTSPTYGIDYSTGGTSATFPAIIETDAIPVGTMLTKKTFKQVEYKLGAPLDTNATVTAQYRVNITDSWANCDTFIADASGLSGYVRVNFQQLQWLQLRVTLTPITSTADSNTFIRFKELRVR